jgi:hypothetical protein
MAATASMPAGEHGTPMSIAANAVPPLATGSLDEVAARLVKTRRYAVVVIVAWFVLGVSSIWLPTPDSALYLMLGRSLAHGHGYALDGQPHAYVPPGYPLFLAALERIGLGSMFCLNLAMGVIGLLSVWMSYRLVGELASRPVAFVVAALLGFNSLLHAMSSLQLSDMPFTLLVLIGLYGFVRGLRGEKWALEWGTLAMLASCWVRVAGVALAVACACGLLLQPRSTSRLRVAGNVVALFVGVAVTLAVFYFQYQNCLRAEHSLPPASYMAGVQTLVSLPIGTLIGRALGNAYESAAEIPKFLMGLQGNPIVALAICLSPVLIGMGRRLWRREFLIAFAAVGYAGGIVMNLPAGARYLLPVAPLLILYYLEGISVLLDWHPRVRRWAPQVLFLFVAAFVALNGAKAAYVFYKNEHKVAADRADMADAAERLRSQARPGEHFLSCYNEWQLAYLSEVPYMQLDRWQLVGGMPREQYLRFLFDQGVRLVVAAPENVSHYPDDVLIREAVRDRRMFQHIVDKGNYELYRYVSPPGVATAESTHPLPGLALK